MQTDRRQLAGQGKEQGDDSGGLTIVAYALSTTIQVVVHTT